MLKVGVFGTGHLGKFHFNNWKEIRVRKWWDFMIPVIRQRLRYQINIIYRGLQIRRLMDQCDAVDIIAPTPEHFSLCELAIRKGKHVFVEKPLANTMDEAKELVKLVKESNIKLQVGHVERFNPAFLALQGTLFNQCS